MITVSQSSDASAARLAAKETAATVGFDDKSSEEIAIAVSELASNLIRHASCGTLKVTPLTEGGRDGIQIESQDNGPGIPNVDRALGDGFSTDRGLGCGLGAVNRLMDELDIRTGTARGTYVLCRRWVRKDSPAVKPSPLAFGVATHSHPNMEVNGDAFIVKQWGESALIGVIDGLGHGQFAHRAAQTARQYVESHFDQPMASIFSGTGRACRTTRGVVMALARFDWGEGKLTHASLGNIETRVFGSPEKMNFIVRRGIIGAGAPNAVVTHHLWSPDNLMVLHSDGLRTHWGWDDFRDLERETATVIAHKLLLALAREEDDATVIIVKRAWNGHDQS